MHKIGREKIGAKKRKLNCNPNMYTRSNPYGLLNQQKSAQLHSTYVHEIDTSNRTKSNSKKNNIKRVIHVFFASFFVMPLLAQSNDVSKLMFCVCLYYKYDRGQELDFYEIAKLILKTTAATTKINWEREKTLYFVCAFELWPKF